jgi:hypothetical protein
MSTSADDHTEEGVEGVQIARSSMYDSESQLDDDCVSENSFGSDFGDNAMDEENMTADIELDSSLPVYLNEKYPESTSALDDMLLPVYVRSPSVDLTVTAAVARVLPPSQYHDTPPTRSTQPALNAMFSGPSMCVVRGLIFNPALISIN